MTPRPTIRDVAHLAGVSKSLVSLALRGSPRVSEESKRAIDAAVVTLGYRPNAAARTLADQRSRAIGVVVSDLANPIYAQVLDSAQPHIRDRDYSTMLMVDTPDHAHLERELMRLLEFQVEGLMVITHDAPEALISRIGSEVPLVVVTQVGLSDLQSACDAVATNDELGAQLAVHYLIEAGHRAIAHLSGGNNEVSYARERGYREAMRNAGLEDFIEVYSGGFTDAAGYRAARQLINESNASALFVANDFSAIGALAALSEADIRVPQEMSVVGFDGVHLGALRTINLTTVAQPLEEIGATAAKVLCERIDTPTLTPRHITIEPRIVVRGTVARHMNSLSKIGEGL